MKKKVLIIVSLFMICLCGCQTQNISSHSTNKSNNANNRNVSNNVIVNAESPVFPIHVDGNVLKQKDFYWNISSITEDNNYIYNCTKDGINKIDKKNGKSKIILKQVKAWKLVLSGKYLYFVIQCEDNEGIFRVDTNGNNFSQVFDVKQIINSGKIKSTWVDANIRGFKVNENKLYIEYGMLVYLFDSSSRKLELLSDDVEKYEVVNEYMYYIDHAEKTFTIYKKNLNNMKTEILLGNGISEPGKNYYDDFVFLKGDMYYSTRIPYGIFRYKNGKSSTIRNREHEYITKLLEYKGYIYYVIVDDDEKNKLMKYNSKNNSSLQVAELKDYMSSETRIVNGYAYYLTENDKVKTVPIIE